MGPIIDYNWGDGYAWLCPDCGDESGNFTTERRAIYGYGLHRARSHDEDDILMAMALDILDTTPSQEDNALTSDNARLDKPY